MLGPLFLRESDTGRTLVRAALDQGRARSARRRRCPVCCSPIARDGATTEHWTAPPPTTTRRSGWPGSSARRPMLALLLAGLAWLEARQGQRRRLPRARGRGAGSVRAEPGPDRPGLGRVRAGRAGAGLRRRAGRGEAARRRCSTCWTGSTSATRTSRPRPSWSRRTCAAAGARRRPSWRPGTALPPRPRRCRGRRLGPPGLRGLLCGWDELDDRFAEALALHARTLDVFESARTKLLYGARLRRARRRSDARGPLREALNCFDRLGARPWADLAAAELEATGETVARRGGDEREALTPRELQIALLLAEGRTTRETAAALFLSPKTVEYHLRHVYTEARHRLPRRAGGKPRRHGLSAPRGCAVARIRPGRYGRAMACRITELVLDCRDPERLAGFWCDVLGWKVLDRDGEREPSRSGPEGGGRRSAAGARPQRQRRAEARQAAAAPRRERDRPGPGRGAGPAARARRPAGRRRARPARSRGTCSPTRRATSSACCADGWPRWVSARSTGRAQCLSEGRGTRVGHTAAIHAGAAP